MPALTAAPPALAAASPISISPILKQHTPCAMQLALRSIWASVLNRDEISIGWSDSFHSLGGTTLAALAICSRARSQHNIALTIRDVFNHSTIESLAAAVKAKEEAFRQLHAIKPLRREDFPLLRLAENGDQNKEFHQIIARTNAQGIRDADIQDILPCSPMAEGLLSETARDGHLAMIKKTLTMTGLDADRLRAAWRRLTAENEMLRSCYVLDACESHFAVQIVLKHVEHPWVLEDWTSVSAETVDKKVADFLRQTNDDGWVANDQPFVRVLLAKTSHEDDAYVFCLTLHHASFDGSTWSELLVDLVAEYDGIDRHSSESQRPSAAEFCRVLAARDREAEREHWKKTLNGFVPRDAPPMQTVFPSSASNGTVNFLTRATSAFTWPVSSTRLTGFASSAGITPAAVAAAAWALCLGDYTSHSDTVFGIAVSGRTAPGLHGTRAMTANVLPLRVKLDKVVTLGDLLDSVSDAIFSIVDVELTSAQDVRTAAGLLDSQSALYHSIVSYNAGLNTCPQPTSGGKWKILADEDHTEFPLALRIDNDFDEVVCSITYLTTVYDADVVAAMQENIVRILNAIMSSPLEAPLGKVGLFSNELIGPALARSIIALGSGENHPCSWIRAHDGFETQACIRPDAVAVDHDGVTLTYRELNLRASALADAIRARGGRPGSLVAIVATKSIAYVLAVLAVCKTGAGYVPVDATFPAQHVRNMCQVSDAALAVGLALHRSVVPEEMRELMVLIDQFLAPTFTTDETSAPLATDGVTPVAADATAFVVFSSGTTGKPKCIPVPHAGITRLLAEPLKTSFIQPGMRVAQSLAIGFDAAQAELFVALATGATLVLPTGEATIETLKTCDVIHVTPTGLSQLDPGAFPRLKQIFIGSEPVTENLVEKWAGGRRMINLYGPTETSCFASGGLLTRGAPVSCGRPLNGTRLYILSTDQRLLPRGAVGELFIGGTGVSPGYRALPEVTSQRFLPDPFAPSDSRMFRTGDLARWLPDGTLCLLGRTDNMVKIKGYRVELDGVARIVALHPRVRRAVCMVEHATLLAFVVAEALYDVDGLRRFVAARVPSYSVPAAFVLLDAFPTNSNGKVDVAALRKRSKAAVALAAKEPPATAAERALAAIWSKCLNQPVADIGRTTSFFEIGGDSLSAIRVVNAAKKAGIAFSVVDLMRHRTLDRLAAVVKPLNERCDPVADHDNNTTAADLPQHELDALEHEQFPRAGIDPTEVAHVCRTTTLQKTMIRALARDPTAYLHSQAWLLDGVSADCVVAAWKAMVVRHEILRTRFVMAGDEIYQVILKEHPVQVRTRAIPTQNSDNHVSAFQTMECKLGFSLESVMHRLTILSPRGSTTKIHVVLTMQHAVFDGFSFQMLAKEFFSLLAGVQLTQAAVPFRKYVGWLNERDHIAASKYWSAALAGMEPNPRVVMTRGELLKDDAASDKLLRTTVQTGVRVDECKLAARSMDVTISALLQVAWALVLSSLTGKTDVCFGVVDSGRSAAFAGVDRIMGPLIQTLPTRMRIDSATSLSSAVRDMRDQLAQSVEQGHLPLTQITSLANLPAESPGLFNSIVVIQFDQEQDSLNNLSFRVAERPAVGSSKDKFLLLDIDVSGSKGIVVNLEHAAADLSEEDGRALVDSYAAALESMLNADPSASICDIKTMTDADLEIIECAASGPVVELPYDSVLIGFEQSVRATPNGVAIDDNGSTITYAELDAQSNQIAQALREHYGVRQGQTVAVNAQRSIAYIVAVVAAMKTGAVYTVLDPVWPKQRIVNIVERTSSVVVVTDGLVALPPLSTPVFLLGRDELSSPSIAIVPVPRFANDATAFFICTSGTTGTPKIVPVGHRGLVNVVNDPLGNMGFAQPGLRCSQFMAVGFDGAACEIWSALTHSATLVLRPNEDVIQTVKTLDMMMITPTALTQMGNPTHYPRLKRVTAVGEKLGVGLASLWAPYVELVNGYGPSETCVFAVMAQIQPEERVPIGGPLNNYKLHVLDRFLRQCPIGVAGELYIGGIGVSKGYVADEERTAKSFLSSVPGFEASGRLYRSGDVVRLLSTGQLECLGRADSQVKVKGYRIELEEVEGALLSHPGVTSGAVIVSNNQLVAFCCPQDLDMRQVRAHMANLLPFYMLPSKLYTMPSLPTNVNGKVDRARLMEPNDQLALQDDNGANASPLLNHRQRQLAEIWAEVLNVSVDDIGPKTSFFARGGDSMSVLRLVTICKKLGFKFTAAHVFELQTLDALAEMSKPDQARAPPTPPAPPVPPQAPVGPQVALAPRKFKLISPAAYKLLHEVAFPAAGIAPEAVQDVYPATAMQTGLLFQSSIDRKSYVINLTWKCGSADSMDGIVAGWKATAARHSILRTRFVATELGIFQVVMSESACPQPAVQHWSEEKFKTQFQEFLDADIDHGLQPDTEFPHRLTVIQVDSTPAQRFIVLTMHHAIYDGFSLGILQSEFGARIANGSGNLTGDLAAAPPTFRSYVELLQNDKDEAKRYWKSYLEGILDAPAVVLPNEDGSDEGPRTVDWVSSFEEKELLAFCREKGVTLATVVKAAWAMTLRSFLRTDDVTFGWTLLGREADIDGIERLIGNLLVTVPVRVKLGVHDTDSALLQSIQRDHARHLKHGHVGLSAMQELAGEKSLFKTLVVLQNAPPLSSGAADELTIVERRGGEVSEYGLSADFGCADGRFCGSMGFTSMDARYAVSVLDYFDHALGALLRGENAQQAGALSKLTAADRALFRRLAVGPTEQIRYEYLHHAFEESASRYSGSTAVEFNGDSLTYGALDAQANVLAHELRSRGVGTGMLTGFVTDRSLEMIIGILAILKTGSGYSPIDHSFPEARKMGMIRRLSSPVVLMTETAAFALPADGAEAVIVRIRSLDDISPELRVKPDVKISSTDVAYCVYSSGTTGEPKGIQIAHIGAVNTIFTLPFVKQVSKGMRTINWMSLGFDVTIMEIFGGLFNGGIVLLKGDNLLEDLHRVDIVGGCSAALLQLDPKVYKNIKIMTTGGEPTPPYLIDTWAPHVNFYWLSGPTEASIVCSSAPVPVRAGQKVTMGRPLNHVRFYVLDHNREPVPIGVKGELFIAGLGVGLGYLGQPEMTAEKFVDDPFALPGDLGKRMYASGDIVRWMPNGEIESHGRKDSQVKIRTGHRVEIQEVELAMNSFGGTSAVVVKNRVLIGFTSPKTIDVDALRAHVAARLPSYMVPETIISLDALPQTASTKVDKAALLAYEIPTNGASAGTSAGAVEMTSEEKLLARVWTQILKLEESVIRPESSLFGLGGDSITALRISAALKAQGVDITTADIFRLPTIGGLAKLIAPPAAEASTPKTSARSSRCKPASRAKPSPRGRSVPYAELASLVDLNTARDIYPATGLQSGMLSATMTDSSAYVMCEAWLIEGVTADALRESWQLVVDNHETLRTRYCTTKQGIYQVVAQERIADVKVIETTNAGAQELVKSIVDSEPARGFDIAKDFLNRMTIVNLTGTDKIYLIITIHHVCYDGYSLQLMRQDLIHALAHEALPERPPFKRFVEYTGALDEAESAEYWRNALQDHAASSPISFALDPAAESGPTPKFVEHRGEVDSAALERFCKEYKVTMSVVIKLAWSLLLSQYLRRQDVIFGFLLSGRDVPLADIEHMSGNLMNTVPTRMNFESGETSLLQALNTLQENYVAAIPFSYSGLTQIAKWADVTAEAGLFHTMLAFQNVPSLDEASAGQLPFSIKDTPFGTANMNTYSFAADLSTAGGHVLGKFWFDSKHMHQAHAVQLAKSFDHILATIIEKGLHRPIRSVIALPNAERQRVLAIGSGAKVDIKRECLHSSFEDSAIWYAPCDAVVHGSRKISYGDLDEQSNALAHHLQTLGVARGSFVPIVTGRSIEMVIGILGILKAGAAYVPIDPKFPTDRIGYIADLSEASVIMGARVTAEKLSVLSQKLVLVDDYDRIPGSRPAGQPNGQDQCYAIFTSGSTGKPKGVVVTHKAVVNNLLSIPSTKHVARGVRTLQWMNVSFDVAIFEIFSSLVDGGVLVLRDEAQDLDELIKTVDIIGGPSSILMHLKPADFPNLKVMTTGGEPCPPALINAWCSQLSFYPLYGPTETCIISSSSEKPVQANRPVSLGRPLANTYFYVLDDNKDLVPFGVAGELHIGGIGIAKGYLKQEALTAQKFLPDPFCPEKGGRMYATGDMVRYLPNGELQSLGRRDLQIKIKGFRVELQEVEAHINSFPEVTSAAAFVKDGVMVAYVTPSAVDVEVLHTHLSHRMPSYMCPTVLVPIEKFPLTTNGKTDKRKLEAMSIQTATVEELQTDDERRLAEIWADLLQVDVASLGRSSSFFELGGDSISTMQLAKAARGDGFVFSSVDVFRQPILRDLARITARAAAPLATEVSAAPVATSRNRAPEMSVLLTLGSHVARLGIDFGNIEDAYAVTPMQGFMLQATMIEKSQYASARAWYLDTNLSIEDIQQAWAALVRHYDILRTRFISTGEGFYQVVLRKADETLAIKNWNEGNIEVEIQKTLDDEIEQGFDVENEYFRRATLATWGSGKAFILTCGHQIYDGWSYSLMMDAFVQLLQKQQLPGPAPRFRDFVDYLRASPIADTREHWTKLMRGAPSGNNLILYSENSLSGRQGSRMLQHTFAGIMPAVKALCQKARVTASTFVKVLWALLLRKYTRQLDVVMGTIHSGRDVPVEGVEAMLGTLINNVPVRVNFDGDKTMLNLLQDLQDQHLNGLEYNNVSITDIQQWTGTTEALFDTLLVFQSYPSVDHDRGMRFEPAGSHGSDGGSFLLTGEFTPGPSDLQLALHYNSAQIGDDNACQLRDDLEHLLLQLIAAGPESKLANLELRSQKEKDIVATIGTGADIKWPFDCLHHGFARTVNDGIHGNLSAVEHGSRSITYNELDENSNALAHHLRSQFGIGKGSIVPLCIQRSIEWIVGLLAILKTGGAYVPLDPDVPATRRQEILQQLGAKCLLVVGEPPEPLAGITVALDVVPFAAGNVDAGKQLSFDHQASGNDLAYMISTSGSTGKPKMVMINHGSVVNVILGVPGQGPDDGKTRAYNLCLMNVAFDSTVFVVWSSLFTGGVLVMADSGSMVGFDRATSVMSCPSGLRALDHSDLPNLKYLRTAGEPLSPKFTRKWAGYCQFYPAYGPTETSIMSSSTFYPVTETWAVTIGTPLANFKYYVLDERKEPVPIGVRGELYIGGTSVSAGYYGQPELTAEKFTDDLFSGGKMYASGDAVCWLPSGEVRIFGRWDDQQVKINGFRIELAEIEGHMALFNGVENAAVVAPNDQLVGYVTPETVDVEVLLQHLRTVLPKYMVPSRLLALKGIPLDRNGKLDRKTLKAMPLPTETRRRSLKADEMRVAEVWSAVVDVAVDEIYCNSSFFEMGGNSISAAKMVARLTEQIGRMVPLNTVYRHPTLEAFTAAVCDQSGEQTAEVKSSIASAAGKESVVASITHIRKLNEETANDKSSHLPHALAHLAVDEVAASICALPTTADDKPIRMLCLHGNWTSGEIFSLQMRAIADLAGKAVEFIFVDAPFKEATSYVSTYFDGPYYSWFNKHSKTSDVKRVLAHLQQKLETVGPIDGLLGFSYGATTVDFLDRMTQIGKLKRTWRFSVLLAGSPIPSRKVATKYQGPNGSLNLGPSLHVWSGPIEEANAKVLIKRYPEHNRRIMTHEEGHKIPYSTAFANNFVRAVKDMAAISRTSFNAGPPSPPSSLMEK
ncbi:hypothetical protein HDU86_002424 [Geranomyces michiganensis]|nr:hypothetical protein HDU86_002424 [Geranomyces michiganensis]